MENAQQPDVRIVDLTAPPDTSEELRLQMGSCIVSIWLPALLSDLGQVMSALAEIGFDVRDWMST